MYSNVTTTKSQPFDFEFPINSDSETTACHMSTCQPVEFVIQLNGELFFSEYLYKPTYSFGNHYLSGYTTFGFKISQRNGRLSFSVLVVVQSLSCVRLFVTSWTAASQDSLSFTISQGLLKLISIESVIPSNHLILCHSLVLLPSVFPSTRVFASMSWLCIRGPKCWSLSSSVSPSNEYSRLISFGID